jgi:hypothetical protein
MKTCIVFGNCHIWPLRKYLTSSWAFNQIYKMIEVPPIQQCDRAKGFDEELLKNCDLFIYQKISDAFGVRLSTDYLLTKLPDRCMRISIGNAYFIPYYPALTTAADLRVPYGDKNVLGLLNQGYRKEQILAILSDENFYSSQDMKKILDDSIADLKRREADVDIPVVDFIELYFRDAQLFYTINHPTYHIMRYVAVRILERLGIPGVEIAHLIVHDLDDIIHPIYPSVIKHLNLSFIKAGDRRYRIGNSFYTFREFMAHYIDHVSR